MPRGPARTCSRCPAACGRGGRGARGPATGPVPTCVVGFGGYVSAAGLPRGPRGASRSVIHEANARAGLANRVGARFTPLRRPCRRRTRCRVRGYVGMPLRRADRRGWTGPASRAEAPASSSASTPTARRCCVFGGSQGARRAQRGGGGGSRPTRGGRDPGAARHRTRERRHLRPRTGRPAPYVAVPYLDRMDLAYAAADLVLCRAGAMTCRGARRSRAARRSTSRCRSATASSGSTPGRSSTAGGGADRRRRGLHARGVSEARADC